MAKDIIAGLKKLDTANDAHWTKDGTPVLAILSIYADGKVSGDDLNTAAPGFNRTSAATYFAPQGEKAAGAGAGSEQPQTGATAPAGPEGGAEQGATNEKPGKEPVKDDEQPQAGDDTNVVSAEGIGDEQDSVLTDRQQQISDLQENLRALSEAQDRLNEAKAETHRQLDALLIAEEESKAATKGTEISDYLRGQERLREQRAEHMRNLASAGITAKTLRDLLPKQAPIDAAMKVRRK